MAKVIQGGKLLDGESLAANIDTNTWVDIQGHTTVGVELYTESNTHVGNISIQESISGSNWDNIQLADDTLTNTQLIPLSSGSATTKLYNLSGLGGKFLKVIYTATSGTGTLDCYVMRKPPR